jgi:hypothetical protein
MQLNTRQDYKGKIYVKNIRKKHVGSETGSGSETNWKVGSNTLLVRQKRFKFEKKDKKYVVQLSVTMPIQIRLQVQILPLKLGKDR